MSGEAVPVEVTIRFVTDLNRSDYDDGATVKDMINVEMNNITDGGMTIDEYIELTKGFDVLMVPVNSFEVLMVPVNSKVHRKVEF